MASKGLKQKMSELPIEMIEEVVVRLPVKDLTRLRCACKKWASLVQNKKFIKKHMTCARQKFLYLYANNDRFCSVVYRHDGYDKPQMILEEHDLMGIDIANGIEVIGHCNGLFCLKYWHSRRLVVWNLSTRELRNMRTTVHSLNAIGFGYDHSIDDYKIVLLPTNILLQDDSSGEILMLKSNHRKISFLSDYLINEEEVGTLLDINLFWIAIMLARREEIIICFDLVSKTFNELPLPPCDWGYCDPVLRQLQVVRGRLCVVDSYRFTREEKIIIWGNNESKLWNKLFTLPIATLRVPNEHWIHSHLVSCYADGGELLVAVKHQYNESMDMFVYDAEEDMFKHVEIGFSFPRTAECLEGPYEYVETLVSTT